MGEPEQIFAEPDEMEKEDVEGFHPHTLEQQNPRFISNIVAAVLSRAAVKEKWCFISIVFSFIAANGWYVVGLLLLGYITWLQVQPKVKNWLRKREKEAEVAEYKKNPDALLAKEQAIDEARRRLQEQYDIAATISLQKKKEMEEKKKQEKIKEWERAQPSGGQTMRSPDSSGASGSAGSSSNTTTNSGKRKPAARARLRPEYNPLTGDLGASNNSRWRPSAQRPSGGG